MTEHSDQDAMIPLPRPTELSQVHWDGCREGKLRVQRCRSCATYVFIPQPCCTHCQSTALAWVETSGRGVVYSYTVVHRAPRPQFSAPYIVAIVAMEEGWHMLSNVVDCAPQDMAIGLAVTVRFKRMNDEITLPYFVTA